MAQERIGLRGVGKSYGARRVLDGIDLSVARHEVVALIGASGSGKSTLLRCVNRLVEIDEGEIRLDGIPIDSESFGKTGLYRRVGIVFQAYNLFPHLTIRENVMLAPVKAHGVSPQEAGAAADHLLNSFGLAEQAQAYPEQISGGQQQRAAVVRALATNPEVLLLDEITAALDPELIGEVLKIVRKLKDQGMTMLVVTHEMAFARELADRVCFLDAGKILEEGPPARLLKAPRHARTQKFLQRIMEAGRL